MIYKLKVLGVILVFFHNKLGTGVCLPPEFYPELICNVVTLCYCYFGVSLLCLSSLSSCAPAHLGHAAFGPQGLHVCRAHLNQLAAASKITHAEQFMKSSCQACII